jgi:cell wall-associated NlpC family hydrolase
MLFASCERAKVSDIPNSYTIDTALPPVKAKDTPAVAAMPPDTFKGYATDSTAQLADSIVAFAETLLGVPYKYAGTSPATGFDCSGFISYVFHHFRIPVPRSSIDFDNRGMEVPPANARRGDLILFTGTDSTERAIGHIGIITSNNEDSILFIHSTSGKAYGVTTTPLNAYYRGRFVKIIRVIP